MKRKTKEVEVVKKQKEYDITKEEWLWGDEKDDVCVVDETNENLLEFNNGIKRAIVYADPPWRYSIEKKKKKDGEENGLLGCANSHYKTMTLTELKSLEVNQITFDDSVLFMWTTSPQFKNSLELMKAWGFCFYDVSMVWVKTMNNQIKGGKLGYYTRQYTEYVIIGHKGNPEKFKLENITTLPDVFLEDTRGHSRKPDRVKKLIDTCFKDVPKIELFARESNDIKWDYWGNQTSTFGSTDHNINNIAEKRMEQLNEMKNCTVEFEYIGTDLKSHPVYDVDSLNDSLKNCISYGKKSILYVHETNVPFNVLKSLKMKPITNTDSILLIWSTGKQIQKTIELMNAWGFKYKTVFLVCVKTTNGKIEPVQTGNCTCPCSKFVLMGTRGKVLKYKNDDNPFIPNVFLEDDQATEDHAKKTIKKLFKNVPKLELFGTPKEDLDWDYWDVDEQEDERDVKQTRENQKNILGECKEIKHKGIIKLKQKK